MGKPGELPVNVAGELRAQARIQQVALVGCEHDRAVVIGDVTAEVLLDRPQLDHGVEEQHHDVGATDRPVAARA